MARRGDTRRGKLDCYSRERGQMQVSCPTGQRSRRVSAPSCRRYQSRRSELQRNTATIGTGKGVAWDPGRAGARAAGKDQAAAT